MTFINISYKGQSEFVEIDKDESFASLKNRIEKLYNIPVENQKLLHPLLKNAVDDTKLSQLDFKKSAKIILMGSTAQQVTEISEKQKSVSKKDEHDQYPEILWETEYKHQKVLEKGLPEGATLPSTYHGTDAEIVGIPLPKDKIITHLRNFIGNKMRMAFKYDHLAFYSDSGTTVLPHEEIVNIKTQSISESAGYSIVLFETIGESVPQKLFVYYVPDVYLPAIYMLNIERMLFSNLTD